MKKEFIERMYSKSSYNEIRFYQVPKLLIENPKYKDVSMAAKLMYSIMRDRQDLSIKNNWLDEDGNIYFYFDCRNLSELCNVSTSTINRYKKDLVKAELLVDIRQGQGNPNKMYILKPESIDNAMISHNDYTRVAETTTLEYSKSLQNETLYSDTKENDTESYKVYKGIAPAIRDIDNFSFDILDKQIEKIMSENYSDGYVGNLTTEDIQSFFRRYYQYGSKIRGIKPTKLRNEHIENIIDSISYISEVDYEPTLDDYKMIIVDYFNQDFPNCDYGINHFVSGDVLLMRYYNLQTIL